MRKFLSTLLAIVICVGTTPVVAFADDGVEEPGVGTAVDVEEMFEGLEAGVDYVENELIVTTSNSEGIALLSVENEEQVSENVSVVEVADGADVAEVAAELLETEGVESVEPNYLFYLDEEENIELETTSINDTYRSQQWHLSDANSNIYNAWDLSKANKAVTVAVIDSGVDSDHPDLVNNIVGATSTAPDSTSVEDVQGHGTHVAGIIAAQANNGLGVAGVSYNAQIMPIRAFYKTSRGVTGTVSTLLAGINYAIQNKSQYNVRVINMSLGTDNSSTAIEQAIDRAWNAGILCVCASGNYGNSNLDMLECMFPASYSKTLAVGSIGSTHAWSSFSHGGDELDVVAPGENIYSTTNGGSYGTMSGTSMAAPYASAVAALCFAKDSSATPQKVTNAICGTAVDLGDSGKDLFYGYGQINAVAALRSLASQTVTKVTMYRLYNPNSGEHFYTSNVAEKKRVVAAGWKDEGVGWTAPSTSSTPVYRLYSGTDHHYTTSLAEKENLVYFGWKYEGVCWYSDDSQSVPLYRQFNPSVNPSASYNNSGSHNYTTSKTENDNLVKLGWRAEGIGWYGIKS